MVQRALIWETRSGRLVEDLPGIGDGPAAFSPDGTLATGSRERDLLLWPLRERLALRDDPVAPSREQVRARAFAIWQARGRLGASALDDWLRAERDLEEARQAGPISLARFSRDGTRVLSAHEFSALRTWDAASHDLLAVVPMRPGRVLEVDAGLSSALLAGAWPDHAGHLALVDHAAADPPFRRWQAPGREDYRHELAAAALTDDGASVFVAVRYVHVDRYDGHVFLSFWCWDPVSGRARELHLQAPGVPSDPVLAPSPGGGDLLLAGPGGWARGRLVQIFSVTDGHCWWQAHVGREAAPTFVPFEAAWNAQGSAFAVTMDHQLFLGERAHPGELRQFAGHEAGGLTWSVCGRFLGVAGRGRARVGEVSSGRTVFDQAFDGRIMALWIAAGGGRLKVAREEGPPFVPIVSEHSF